MDTGRNILGALGRLVSRTWDRGVLVQLSGVHVEKPPLLDLSPVDPQRFWAESRVRDPREVRVARDWESLDGGDWRELELLGDSEGPGTHPGSRNLVATAHVRRNVSDAPLVLLVHGYAVPFTGFDRWIAWRMRRRGAHTARIELPFHLRRTPTGERSGDHFFSIDPAHTRAVVRQSVEDTAAIVQWARREVTQDVRVVGTSLGGLIGLLLTALVEVDLSVGIAPLCDPSASFTERPPGAMQHYMGMVGAGENYWGSDRASARRALDGALAPLVVRNLVPATRRDRITVVEPVEDLIVGAGPMEELAAAWNVALWRYPHGHLTVMNAPGVPRRIVEHVTAALDRSSEHLAMAG